MDKRKSNSGKKVGDRSDLLTKEEMDRLMNAVAGDLYFTAFYKTMRYTGRRLGEIYGTYRGKELAGGIKVSDVDFNENTLKTVILKTKKRNIHNVCKECNKKNSHKNLFCMGCGCKLDLVPQDKLKYSLPEEITMIMRPEVSGVLKNYITKNKLSKNKYLFREKSLIYLKKQIKVHIKQASVEKKFSLHGFRHYFITALIREGISSEQIIKITGHKSVATLSIYNRLVPKDVEAKVAKVEL